MLSIREVTGRQNTARQSEEGRLEGLDRASQHQLAVTQAWRGFGRERGFGKGYYWVTVCQNTGEVLELRRFVQSYV